MSWDAALFVFVVWIGLLVAAYAVASIVALLHLRNGRDDDG